MPLRFAEVGSQGGGITRKAVEAYTHELGGVEGRQVLAEGFLQAAHQAGGCRIGEDRLAFVAGDHHVGIELVQHRAAESRVEQRSLALPRVMSLR